MNNLSFDTFEKKSEVLIADNMLISIIGGSNNGANVDEDQSAMAIEKIEIATEKIEVVM